MFRTFYESIKCDEIVKAPFPPYRRRNRYRGQKDRRPISDTDADSDPDLVGHRCFDFYMAIKQM